MISVFSPANKLNQNRYRRNIILIRIQLTHIDRIHFEFDWRNCKHSSHGTAEKWNWSPLEEAKLFARLLGYNVRMADSSPKKIENYSRWRMTKTQSRRAQSSLGQFSERNHFHQPMNTSPAFEGFCDSISEVPFCGAKFIENGIPCDADAQCVNDNAILRFQIHFVW